MTSDIRRCECSAIEELSEDEFLELEGIVAKLTAIWEIKNLFGLWCVYWDDQHIGEKRQQLRATKHASVDVENILAFQATPVVDSLEGNSLWRLANTPIVVVSDDCLKARATWWTFGIESVSKFREKPEALWTIGVMAASLVKEDGEWRVLHPWWHRITKNRYAKSWVHDMVSANARPPLTPEEDRAAFGKCAYFPDRMRPAVPEPPADSTWAVIPDETDDSWIRVNQDGREDEAAE